MSTYRIVRFYKDSERFKPKEVIDTGLTLQQAQDHCNDPSTHEPGVWFDGYEEELEGVRVRNGITAVTLCGMMQGT